MATLPDAKKCENENYNKNEVKNKLEIKSV